MYAYDFTGYCPDRVVHLGFPLYESVVVQKLLERMPTFLLIIVSAFVGIACLMQWMQGWSYLCSSSARRKMREDLRANSRFSRFAEVLSIVFGFVIVNVLIAVILWRVLVGPIKPIHEW